MQSFDIGTRDATSTLACCRLGQGLTLSSLEPASQAVSIPTATNRTPTAERDAVRYEMRVISRNEMRAESTRLRGSFRASLAIISGTVEGGARWADSSARQYSYIRATVTVITSIQSVDLQGVTLLPGLDLDEAGFADLYGDGFVASVTYGGQLDAVVSINNTESEKIRDFDLKGEIDAGIASASGSFEQKLREATSGREVDIDISQSGGALEKTSLSPDLESLIAAVKNFPSQVRADQDAAVPLSFDAIKYKNLESVLRENAEPKSLTRLPVTRETLLIEQLSATLQQYEIARRIVANKIDLDLVRADPEQGRQLVEAYRRVQNEKARAMNDLVIGTLAPDTLDEERVDGFPLALVLLKGGEGSNE